MRKPCCDKEGTNKGAWSKQEDQKLVDYIKAHGEGCWRSLPEAAGLQRCGKSCRLRWINYLRPDIKRGNFGQDEEDLIIKLHALLGNRWSLIAGRLPGRTDNEVKNYWNSHIRKKLIKLGIDPNNHKLNQVHLVQAQIPVLRAASAGHERLNPSAAHVGSAQSHACKTSTTKPTLFGENKIEIGSSDAASCLDDETSGASDEMNLDLTIAFPSPDELIKLDVGEIETQSREYKLAKEVEIIGNGVIASPTLVLFR